MIKNRANNMKKPIAYSLYPLLFVTVAITLYLAGGKLLVEMAIDDFKLAAIQGAPEYTYQEMNQITDQKQDGILKTGEVKLPSVGKQFGQLACEEIGLKAPLYYGDDQEILSIGAGMYIGSSLPGQGSITLVGGHDTTFFKPLSEVKVGDVLALTTIYGEFTYTVTKMNIADILDNTAYQPKTQKETMILYTCYPFGEVNSNRTKRYYVYAEKVTGPNLEEE